MKKNFKFIFLVLFIGFIIMYGAQKLGYAAYYEHEKKVLTEEKIIEFEEDIKNNKDVSMKDYVETTSSQYTNKWTNTCYNVSKTINKYMRDGVEFVFKFINKMVSEET